MILALNGRSCIMKMFYHAYAEQYYPILRSCMSGFSQSRVSRDFEPGEIFIWLGPSGVSRYNGLYLAPDGQVCLSMVVLTPMFGELLETDE